MNSRKQIKYRGLSLALIVFLNRYLLRQIWLDLVVADFWLIHMSGYLWGVPHISFCPMWQFITLQNISLHPHDPVNAISICDHYGSTTFSFLNYVCQEISAYHRRQLLLSRQAKLTVSFPWYGVNTYLLQTVRCFLTLWFGIFLSAQISSLSL